MAGLVHYAERAALDELYLIQPFKLLGWGQSVEAEYADNRLHIQPHRATHAAESPLAGTALEGLHGLPVLWQYREEIQLGLRCLGLFGQLAA